MRASNFQSPFLDRQEELALLEQLLADAHKGNARLLTVSGEAGSGKTRLIEELRRRHSAAATFIGGRAFSATAHTPYAVWVDALELHLRKIPRREAIHLLDRGKDLRRLFPAVSERLSLEDGASYGGEAAPDRGRIFGQMSSLLSSLVELSTVVLVLDNLHWADRSSLELLHAVARTASSRLLIVALYRAEEVANDSSFLEYMSSLHSAGFAESLTLPPLSVAATASIVQAGIGQRWPYEDVRRLHSWTQGNALFIWECIKHSIARNCGRPFREPDSEVQLPESLGSLIAERSRELDDDSRRVLAIASVIEVDIGYSLLKAVTGYDDERLLVALDRLTAQRFLNEVVNEADVTYEFHKPLVQATVYRSLGAARRLYLHHLIATEMMALPAGELAASRVARHLLASTREGRQQSALPYLLRAGKDAVEVFGNHEAISLLTVALRIASDSPGHAESLFELHLNLGESHKRLGMFDDAVRVWSDGLARSDAAGQATLRRCMARALWQAGREQEATDHLEAGVRDLESADAGAAGALLRQELALSMARQGNVTRAISEANGVLATVDADTYPELAARLHIVLCLAHGYRGEMRLAREYGAKAIELSDSLPYPGAAFLAHYTLAALLRYDGDPAIFEAYCTNCDAIAARMHAVALESWPLSIRVERYCFLGRMKDAIATGERAVEIDQGIGQITILPRTHAFLAIAHRLTGNVPGAQHHLGEAQRLVAEYKKTELRSTAVVEMATAYVDFLDGRYDSTIERLDALATRLEIDGPLRFYALHPHMLPLAAEAAARGGVPDRAAELIATIRKMQSGAFGPADAAVAHVTGLLAVRDGRTMDAKGALETAANLYKSKIRRYDGARVIVDLAQVLESKGQSGAAVDLLVKAGAEFEEMGAVRDAASVRQKLRGMGVRPAQVPSSRVLGSPLSAREVEIVGLVTMGKTNKEIASDLFLSELTIETHVKNILRKLGLKSRVQVAAHASKLQEDADAGSPRVIESYTRTRG